MLWEPIERSEGQLKCASVLTSLIRSEHLGADLAELRSVVHPSQPIRATRWLARAGAWEDAVVTCFKAVLFDWRGTLVHIPNPVWHVARALESIGREAERETVDSIIERVRGASDLSEFIEAERVIDLSAEFHHATTIRMYDEAGLDSELAEALYRVEWELEARPAYADVAATLGAVRGRGAKVAVVSDIHFDIRPDCIAQGIDAFTGAYVLSCELGIQKPDPRMFLAATSALGVRPSEALMVGDSAATDGGAAAVGIATHPHPPKAR
jgi:HAD superfamily hydrolase (TIGR01509 family)